MEKEEQEVYDESIKQDTFFENEKSKRNEDSHLFGSRWL